MITFPLCSIHFTISYHIHQGYVISPTYASSYLSFLFPYVSYLSSVKEGAIPMIQEREQKVGGKGT